MIFCYYWTICYFLPMAMYSDWMIIHRNPRSFSNYTHHQAFPLDSPSNCTCLIHPFSSINAHSGRISHFSLMIPSSRSYHDQTLACFWMFQIDSRCLPITTKSYSQQPSIHVSVSLCLFTESVGSCFCSWFMRVETCLDGRKLHGRWRVLLHLIAWTLPRWYAWCNVSLSVASSRCLCGAVCRFQGLAHRNGSWEK